MQIEPLGFNTINRNQKVLFILLTNNECIHFIDLAHFCSGYLLDTFSSQIYYLIIIYYKIMLMSDRKHFNYSWV